MRKLIILLVIALGCSSQSVPKVDGDAKNVSPPTIQHKDQQAAPALLVEKYKSPDGKFAVRFPRAPELVSLAPDPSVSKVESTIYSDEVDATHSFAISYARYSEIRKDAMESARDTFVNSVNGELTEDKAISLGNIPGKEFAVKYGQGQTIRVQHFISGLESFHVYVIVPSGKEYLNDVDSFFSSFEILHK